MSLPSREPVEFDRHATDYEAQLMLGLALSGESPAYFAAGRVELVRETWSRVQRFEPRRIIDYGCGVGATSAVLARRFPHAQVQGLDPSRRCIELAASQSAGRRVRFDQLLVGDLRDGGGADLIYLNGVVHHVEPADRPRLFDDLAARLAPGGLVTLFENNPLNPGARLVMARIPFDRDAIPLLAREARSRLGHVGLTPIDTTYLFFFPRILRWLRPFERILRRLPVGAQYCVAAVGLPPGAITSDE